MLELCRAIIEWDRIINKSDRYPARKEDRQRIRAISRDPLRSEVLDLRVQTLSSYYASSSTILGSICWFTVLTSIGNPTFEEDLSSK